MLNEVSDMVREYTKDHPLELWWRDDDFGKMSSNAIALFDNAKRNEVPLLVAVVPYRLAVSDKEFQKKIANNGYGALIAFGVHGFDHMSHDAKKPSEYPPGRDADNVRRELHYGFRRVRQTFKQMARPFFVPPWNNMGEEFIDILKEEGYTLLSSCNESYHDKSADNFSVRNVDLDLLDYTTRPFRLHKPKKILDELSRILETRLSHEAPPSKLGLLTHHVEMTPDDIEQCGQLARAVLAGGAIPSTLDSLFSS